MVCARYVDVRPKRIGCRLTIVTKPDEYVACYALLVTDP